MFWKDEDKEDDKLAENINRFVDDLNDRQTLKRFLYIFAAANLLIWLCVLVFPHAVREGFETVSGVSDKIAKITLAVPFGIGFYLTYALFRLKFPDIEEQNLESIPMASFNYNAKSAKRWRVWLLSAVGGVLNVLVLILTDIFLSGN